MKGGAPVYILQLAEKFCFGKKKNNELLLSACMCVVCVCVCVVCVCVFVSCVCVCVCVGHCSHLVYSSCSSEEEVPFIISNQLGLSHDVHTQTE